MISHACAFLPTPPTHMKVMTQWLGSRRQLRVGPVSGRCDTLYCPTVYWFFFCYNYTFILNQTVPLFASSWTFPPQPHVLQMAFLCLSSAGDMSGILFVPEVLTSHPLMFRSTLKSGSRRRTMLLHKVCRSSVGADWHSRQETNEETAIM